MGKLRSCQKPSHHLAPLCLLAPSPVPWWLGCAVLPDIDLKTPHLPVLKDAFFSSAPSTTQLAVIQHNDQRVTQAQSKAATQVIASNGLPGTFVQKFSSKHLGLAILQWWSWHAKMTVCHLSVSSAPSSALHVPKLLVELPLVLMVLSIQQMFM